MVVQTYSDSESQTAGEFWRVVVDPGSIGMPESIAGEIASYTGEPLVDVLQKMETGMHDLKKMWEGSEIDRTDPESVASFYRDQFVEAYELANWHCGRTNGEVPLNYAYAALFAKARGLKRALDYGAGIGTGSLCLASAGCEVESADVARDLVRFTGHRMSLRGFTPRLIDLNTPNRPRRNYYDIVTCFDVLEHVPDQLATLRMLATYLRRGGYLLVNLMDDSTHDERPMHISSAGDWLAMVRKTRLKPEWPSFGDGFQVLTLNRTAWLTNRIAGFIEDRRRP